MNYLTIQDLYKLFLECDQKITTDTRKIENDSIFFALKGENFDANTFATTAIESGSKYAIVDNPNYKNDTNILFVENVLTTLQQLAKYHRQQLSIPVIGITGSNGKTTNKELIHAVLSKKYKTYATFGNLNNHIGVPLTLLKLTKEHEMAIVEMGANHQGEIAMLSELACPNFGLITNVGKAHMEGFGGVEGIKKGKSELYKYIKNNNGKIFINGDDIVLSELAAGMTSVKFGENESYSVYGKMLLNSEFVEFQWGKNGEELFNKPVVKTNMFGHYNFINLLCAACIGNYFGVEESLINQALAEYMPEMNRSQVKKTNKNTLVLDAYNANPSSMSLAILNFAKQKLQGKICVLGDMLELGEYSADEHQKIIQLLKENELLESYLVGPEFFKLKNDNHDLKFFENTDSLVEYLKLNTLTNKTILIKGSRGIKLEKIVDVL